MAKYRQLYTEFWSDSFVLELTPEEKYFYLYLISNSKTTQCGIYEISKRIIETETGYNRETVEKLIKRFCDYNKILYCEETKELMIVNWIKYNAPNNINAIKCVHKELTKVKHQEFIKILFDKCSKAGFLVETIFENLLPMEAEKSSKQKINKPLNRGIKGACKRLPSNRIRSNKKELINNNQEGRSKEEEIITAFQENVHAITPIEAEKLLEYAEHVNSEVIILAIKEAVNHNAKTMNYITKILNCWISSGIKTAVDVASYKKQWKIRKDTNLDAKVKKGGFCDYEQRVYDFDVLEKRLLGTFEEDINEEDSNSIN
jgi:DnaD/phage-associated family protein